MKGTSEKKKAIDKVLLNTRRRENQALTTAVAAVRLSLNREILMRHIRAGNITTFKIGKQYRVTEAEIERIMLVGLPTLDFDQSKK